MCDFLNFRLATLACRRMNSQFGKVMKFCKLRSYCNHEISGFVNLVSVFLFTQHPFIDLADS